LSHFAAERASPPDSGTVAGVPNPSDLSDDRWRLVECLQEDRSRRGRSTDPTSVRHRPPAGRGP